MGKKIGCENIFWDLTHFYTNIVDQKITEDINNINNKVSSFSIKYQGKIKEIDANKLFELISEHEEICQRISRINSYAYLNFATQTNNDDAGAFLQKIQEIISLWKKDLLFFNLEWSDLDEDLANNLIKNPIVVKYRHHLEKIRNYKPYLLSEKEERLLAEFSPVTANSWVKLFNKIISQKKFGKTGKTEEEVLSNLYKPKREVRIRAAQEFTDGLSSEIHVLTHIFNTILGDKMIRDRVRRYPTWISSMNLDNEIKDTNVEVLVNAVQSRYDIPQRYYRLKKTLLTYDELFDYDRYAPLPSSSNKVLTWDQARNIVTKAYYEFSPEVGEIVQRFFTEKWIHAPVLFGKRGGAFAHPTTPDVHPYLLVNYSGTSRNVQTLAHELGHGIHQYLAGKSQGYFNTQVPLTMAETASVFGEMLVFQELLRRSKSQTEKLSLLCTKLEDIIATVFRQTAMNRFENAVHTERRENGELSTEKFSELWITTQKEMFGDSVTLTDNYKLWWSYIPHFLHTPGYVYSYAFGELLALSLYEKYKEEGETFIPKYKELLASGGKDIPSKLLENLGISIDDPNFWLKGLKIIDNLLDQTEELI